MAAGTMARGAAALSPTNARRINRSKAVADLIAVDAVLRSLHDGLLITGELPDVRDAVRAALRAIDRADQGIRYPVEAQS